MKTVKPGSKRLFCKPDEVHDTKTRSGILLAASTQEKPYTAEVINVGSEVHEYKQHDKILYKPYATTEVKLNGESYFVIDEEDTLGIVVEVKGE